MKKLKYLIITLVLALLTTLVISKNTYAATSIISEGKYSVTYSISGQSGIGASMIKKYLKSEATIENINSNYYLSITTLSSSMEDLTLIKDENKSVGLEILNDEEYNDVYRYTVTHEDLESDLNFSVYVSLRKETYTFTLRFDINNATLITSEVDKVTDRPALYVPTLSGDFSDSYELERGITFNIPEYKAYFNGSEIEVTYDLYYNNGSSMEAVEIKDSKATLSNVGNYILSVSASTSEYKTLLGNDTNVLKTINITTTTTGSSIAKVKDTNNVLTSDYYLIASKLTVDSATYNTVSNKIKKISENYEVFELSLVDNTGSEISLSNDIIISVKANDTYDRNKIEVYYLNNEGNLQKVDSTNAGRYVDINVESLGTYVICIPGVTFVMPIWGYILICVGIVLLIGLVVFLIIFFVRRNKKKNKDTNGEIKNELLEESKKEEYSKKEYKHWRQEVELIPKMIRIYCKGKHKTKDGLCTECEELKDYALFRLSKCPFKVNKGFCSFCKIHCYKPDMREKIKDVMKYSGPRMLFSHPIFSISHVVQMIKYKKSLKQKQKEEESK